MTIKVTSPATIFELAELGGASTSLGWNVLREMWHNGDTWGRARVQKPGGFDVHRVGK